MVYRSILNFKPYTPKDPIDRVLYLISECGIDWYECQSIFKSNRYKITVADDGLITSYSRDISTLFPLNCSVYEIEEDLPKDILLKNYYFLNGDIVENIDILNELRTQRAKEFKALDMLDLKVSIGRISITQEEKIEIDNWYKHWLDIDKSLSQKPIMPNKVKYFYTEG